MSWQDILKENYDEEIEEYTKNDTTWVEEVFRKLRFLGEFIVEVKSFEDLETKMMDMTHYSLLNPNKPMSYLHWLTKRQETQNLNLTVEKLKILSKQHGYNLGKELQNMIFDLSHEANEYRRDKLSPSYNEFGQEEGKEELDDEDTLFG